MSVPVREIYTRLLAAFGTQGWWPADSPLEMMVGAILTQNTAWVNVEKAIARLKSEDVLQLPAIHEVPLSSLAAWIRPVGYFNLKARRLRALTTMISEQYQGDLTSFLKEPADRMRNQLLSVWGIGPETADSIVLYAAHHARFVVDAYTRRFLERHKWLHGAESYDEVAGVFTRALSPNPVLFNDFHALIVRLAKNHCHARNPDCEHCPLGSILPPDSLPVEKIGPRP